MKPKAELMLTRERSSWVMAYTKSDADRYIGELENKIRVMTLIIEDAKRDLLRQAKEIRHQKYKRCLAMARWCASRSASWCFDPSEEQLHKSEFYDKWKHRWLELAEKFKEANDGICIQKSIEGTTRKDCREHNKGTALRKRRSTSSMYSGQTSACVPKNSKRF